MPLHLLGFALLALSLIGCAYTAGAAALVGRYRAPSPPPLSDAPPVSILKPLHGAEPRLADNLAGFTRQDWPARVEVVCGVGDARDPARGVAEGLGLCVVVAPPPAGPRAANGKIANLTAVAAAARHDILIQSDSDIAVAPDYVARIVAALDAPGVGAVTCLYAGRGDAGGWSRLAAGGISYQFLPNVAVGVALGLARPCMGSTIALRAETLRAIGGFARFADVLADDHAVGAAVRALGLEVVLPPMIVTHGCAEASLAALVRHELRWQATVRDLDSVGHAGSLVTHPLPLALLAAACGAPLWGIAAALASRLVLAWRVDRIAPVRAMPLLWLPGRDILSFALHIASFFVRSVDWRGAKLLMEHDGRIAAGTESPPR